jgi:hypothetical protein
VVLTFQPEVTQTWSSFFLSIFTTIMSSSAAARQRLQALSKQLVEGIPDEGSFEGIPKIRHIASDSAGP